MKQSLSIVRDTLKSYVEKLYEIEVETDEEFFAVVNKCKSELLADIESLRTRFPEAFYLNYDKELSSGAAKGIVGKIAKKAQSNYALGILPSTEFMIDKIQGDNIVTPSFILEWDGFREMELPEGESAKDMLASFLLNVIMYLPIKKVNITIVDIDNSFLAEFLYKNIDGSLYHENPISDVETFKNFLHSMNERVLNCVKQYGNLIEYNIAHKTIAEPYEVVVIFDTDGQFLEDNECMRLAEAINKNGEKAGVYMIYFTKGEQEMPKTNLIGITPITTIPALRDAVVNYINDEAKKEVRLSTNTLDIEEYKKPYLPMDDSIRVEVGKNGRVPVEFKMDIGIRAHAFVLGQSGSGKSVFLHDVISGAMLKYSPEDLEFYLLDFKLGGVEFNRYKGEKHVHAMLVDNSDPQITLEILRELRGRMAERGMTLRQAGFKDIKEYNEQHPDNKMKHILFVADECHEMFHVDNKAISNEISDVIVKIAKQGRSLGVHLLLATQTIANTDISNEILSNIGNHYLLKCASADSDKMVSNSSDITSKLTTGKVYYHNVDEEYVFQAFYADKTQTSEIIQTIYRKTNFFVSNEVFYFSGASIFHFDPSAAILENAHKCRKAPVVFAGKSIDVKQIDVTIQLKEDFSENILLLGLNDEYQSTRVSMNLLISLLSTCKYREADVKFKVINCLSEEDKYREVLNELENAGLIDIVPAKKRASLFKQLSEEIMSGNAKETILFILGQDRFRELKLDLELEEESRASDDSGLMRINSSFLKDSSSNNKRVMSFSKAMDIILEKGPEVGVHTIIQLEKASNCLFEDNMIHKDLFQKFKHLLLLRADENATTLWKLSDEIHLEKLSKDEERLRAYYYAEESDTYTLFTPYMPVDGNELKEFIKTL